MIRIVYFGTSAFAVPPLEALLAARDRFEVAAVVSRQDKPVGRAQTMTASPVAAAARAADVRLMQPKTLKDGSVADELRLLQADAFVVAAYGRIVPRDILDIPRRGCLNLHGSLLPAYRGASPIQAAILAGETETGVTLMLMDEQVDHGPTLASVTVPMTKDDTHGTLELRLADAAAKLLVGNLEDHVAGRLAPREQDHDAATFTKIIAREDGFIAWEDEDAASIERKRRAFDPWPGIYAIWERKGRPLRLKILSCDVVAADGVPGAVSVADGEPVVAARSGSLVLHEVQLEGRSVQTGRAFLNGYADLAGAVLASADPSAEPGSKAR